MSIDSFYTPKVLADKLLSFINKREVESVADFCVGDGELLRAASCKWRKSTFWGIDISSTAIKKTRRNHPEWELEVLDFMDRKKREKSKILRLEGAFDVVLLNPPFSCVGGLSYEVYLNGERFHVSTAMKFIVEALNYLKPNGVLYAILPASTAYSQKDQKIWQTLEQTCNLSILEELSVNFFKGCSPNVILVSINDHKQKSKAKLLTRIALDVGDLEIFRGKISMFEIPKRRGGHYLVHTTNLINNRIQNLSVKVAEKQYCITGPAILLPRVGNPKVSKLCLISEDQTYVLSDCIIAVRTQTMSNAKILFKYMIDNWALVENLYKGTGAKYITIEKVKQFLNLDFESIQYSQEIAI